MIWDKTKQGVWVVYDGECPICAYFVETANIKRELGELTILDAREHKNHSLLTEINKREFDLDQGMVIFVKGDFYYGQAALHFLAQYSEHNSIFKRLLLHPFKSNILSRLFYPAAKRCRAWLLKRKNVGGINNLINTPIFKSVFGESWNALPTVMKKHYINRPYSTDVTQAQGTVTIFCKPPLIWFSVLINFFGLIPAQNKSDVFIRVDYTSERNTRVFHLIRSFYFLPHKPYVFHSKMMQVKNNTIAEIMKLRFTWLCDYSWDGEKVTLAHRGYALYLFSYFIPLPLTYVLGAGNAYEYPINDSEFKMEVTITHPWWGKIYGYNGRFKVKN